MKRIDSTNKAVDLFGPGKHGFQGGNPSLNLPATFFTPEWTNHIQEEIANVIEYFGTALNDSSKAQLINTLIAKFARLNADGTISSTADASLASHLTRLSQVQSLLSAQPLNNRPGHTYTNADWAWQDKGQGMIVQYANVAGNIATNQTYNFPTNFPNEVLLVLGQYASVAGSNWIVSLDAISLSQYRSTWQSISSSNGAGAGVNVKMYAFGR